MHSSSLNIASNEMFNAEILINRHVMVQQHQQNQQQHFQKRLQKQQQHSNELHNILDLENESTQRSTSLINKQTSNITEDTEEEEDELSIEDCYLGTIEENRLEILKELGLSKQECESILSIPASQNFDDLRLFVRLCPYFNGRYFFLFEKFVNFHYLIFFFT